LLLFPTGEGASSTPDEATINLSANSATARIGGGAGDSPGDGVLKLNNKLNANTVSVSGGAANIRAGGNGTDGDILLFPNAASSLANDAQSTIAESSAPPPGSVMIIDAEGKLRLSDRRYDTRVAGIIAGAGDTRPGIILGRSRCAADGARAPIALAGRVYCKVDARDRAVCIGDLLTTSDTVGAAMRADDRDKAFGSVLGKALAPLQDGVGMIPVLVALQ
jgi:hypothetical protein